MKRVFALLLCAVMVLTAAACTKNETNTSSVEESSSIEEVSSVETTSSEDAEVSSEEADTSSEEETSSEEIGTYTMEEIVSEIQAEMDSMKDSYAEMGINMNIIARDNSLVYQYQYSEDVGDLDAMKEALEAAISEQDSVFENLLTMVKNAVPDANGVVVEYLNADGTLIFAKEYK